MPPAPTSPPPGSDDDDDNQSNTMSSSEDSSPTLSERREPVAELQGVAHSVHQALVKEYSHVS